MISRGVSGSAEKLFTVWLVAKEDKKTYRYNLKGKPRGITVLSRDEKLSHENSELLGETAKIAYRRSSTCGRRPKQASKWPKHSVENSYAVNHNVFFGVE